jgi:phage baseplate assembly protein W
MSKLYDKVVVKGPNSPQVTPGTKTYKGFSTISTETESFSLYDLALIKQDLINHFHVRKGERLEQPDFGTIIWDIIFEPLTDDVKRLIISDVQEIINYDPRLVAEDVIVTEYESGIIIECSVTYLPYYITELLQFRFDQANGLLAE